MASRVPLREAVVVRDGGRVPPCPSARRDAGALASGQGRDGLAVDRAAAAATAEHAALDAELSAAPAPMHDPSIDDLPDHAPAHQAREIGLDDSPATRRRHDRRLLPRNYDCHDGPPKVSPAHTSVAAVQHVSIVCTAPPGFCLDEDGPSVPQVTLHDRGALLSSGVAPLRGSRSRIGEMSR